MTEKTVLDGRFATDGGYMAPVNDLVPSGVRGIGLLFVVTGFVSGTLAGGVEPAVLGGLGGFFAARLGGSLLQTFGK